MEDLLASIPVIIATLIIIGAIFWFANRNKKQREQKIIQLAGENGWAYENVKARLAWGYRLKGKGWMLEAISRSSEQTTDSGSSNVSHATQWYGEAKPALGRMVFIGERSPDGSSGFGGTMMQQAVHMALGSQAAGLSEVQAGTSALRERYLFFARTAEDVEGLMTPGLIQLLANWAGKPPVIKLTGDGIQVNIRDRRVEKPEEILRIVHLGEALLETQLS
jgi:hypothetical protein